MKKLSKEQVKKVLAKRPHELSKEELSFLFYIFSFQLKEYYSGESNISFEIHFDRTYIIRVSCPRDKGLMNFGNEFVNFGEGSRGVAMPRAKDTGELIRLFVNMFHDTLLAKAHYSPTYDEVESMFDSQEEASDYLKFVQELI